MKYLSENLQISLPDSAAELKQTFTVPLYITRRYRGTITIIAGDEKLTKDDPFNRAHDRSDLRHPLKLTAKKPYKISVSIFSK